MYIYSDTKIIKSDTEQSLYFKPDQDEPSNTFQFEWYSGIGEINSFRELFKGCDIIDTVNLESYLETRKIIDMQSLFDSCTSLKKVDSFYPVNVQDMSYMFNESTKYEKYVL